jgi:hypothetical protein
MLSSRPGWMQARLEAGQAGSRPGWKQARLEAGQAGCRPGWAKSGPGPRAAQREPAQGGRVCLSLTAWLLRCVCVTTSVGSEALTSIRRVHPTVACPTMPKSPCLPPACLPPALSLPAAVSLPEPYSVLGCLHPPSIGSTPLHPASTTSTRGPAFLWGLLRPPSPPPPSPGCHPARQPPCRSTRLQSLPMLAPCGKDVHRGSLEP